MALEQLTVYLSGEIHTSWREDIARQINERKLNVKLLAPVVDHEASDDVGVNILGTEEKSFWKDHKAAKINAIRIRSSIERADVVVVKFGDKYRQWNAAFDAGYAIAKGKSLITLRPDELEHAMKEVDAQAMAVTTNVSQVVEILKYAIEKG